MIPSYVGALVRVDGQQLAVVRGRFPEGSTSYLFPHVRVDFVDDAGRALAGGKNIAIALYRIKKGPTT